MGLIKSAGGLIQRTLGKSDLNVTRKNIIEVKYKQSAWDFNSDGGDITEMTFSNMIKGQVYRFHVKVSGNFDGNAGHYANCYVKQNAGADTLIYWYYGRTAGIPPYAGPVAPVKTFISDGTPLVTSANGATGGANQVTMYGDGTSNGTYIELETLYDTELIEG